MLTRERYRGRLTFSAGEMPALTIRLQRFEDPLKLTQALVTDYQEDE